VHFRGLNPKLVSFCLIFGGIVLIYLKMLQSSISLFKEA
jgi:hypothetical protein